MTRSLFSNEDSIDKIVEYIESSEKEVNTKRKKEGDTESWCQPGRETRDIGHQPGDSVFLTGTNWPLLHIASLNQLQ